MQDQERTEQKTTEPILLPLLLGTVLLLKAMALLTGQMKACIYSMAVFPFLLQLQSLGNLEGYSRNPNSSRKSPEFAFGQLQG